MCSSMYPPLSLSPLSQSSAAILHVILLFTRWSTVCASCSGPPFMQISQVVQTGQIADNLAPTHTARRYPVSRASDYVLTVCFKISSNTFTFFPEPPQSKNKNNIASCKAYFDAEIYLKTEHISGYHRIKTPRSY